MKRIYASQREVSKALITLRKADCCTSRGQSAIKDEDEIITAVLDDTGLAARYV